VFPLRLNYETYALPLFSIRMWNMWRLGAMQCDVCSPVFIFPSTFSSPPPPQLMIQITGRALQGSVHNLGKRLCSSPNSKTGAGAHPASYLLGKWESFTGDKAAGM
jgi:hypothetical protein